MAIWACMSCCCYESNQYVPSVDVAPGRGCYLMLRLLRLCLLHAMLLSLLLSLLLRML